MSAGMSAGMKVKNPGKFEAPASFRTLLAILSLIGIVTFLVGLKVDPTRSWVGFLHNHFFFLSLGLGGLFFAGLQWAVGAMWSSPVRRLSEALAAYLPIVAVFCVLLYFGVSHLYLWSHADHVQNDLVLKAKTGYLNTGFFMIRNFIAIGLWIYFGHKIIGNSVAQDHNGEFSYTLKNRFLAPLFIVVFTLSFTMASYDLVMSLDPYWFSTIFGVYCFAGLFYSTLAAICLMAIYFKSNGRLEGIVNDNHLHDLGKLMFAFVIFWAYIGFSQFMLLWYANLPEETGYFIHRLHGGWFYVSLFLLVGKFALPFLIMLPRGSKRNPRLLAVMGTYMLLCQWIDVMWMVQPEFFKEGPVFGWMEFGITLGFLGIFGLTVCRFLAKNNLVAIGDPRLAEAVYHHHQ